MRLPDGDSLCCTRELSLRENGNTYFLVLIIKRHYLYIITILCSRPDTQMKIQNLLQILLTFTVQIYIPYLFGLALSLRLAPSLGLAPPLRLQILISAPPQISVPSRISAPSSFFVIKRLLYG